ncbi:MAG TPA: sigma-70 family RNA polymerase sigma factor [Planctomycetota bacterium]
MADHHLDEKFVQFVRTGDRKALEFVFERTEERLRHRAHRLLGDARAAEDIVQELFLGLLIRCDTYEAGRPCMPYLIGVLHRRAITWRERSAMLQRLPRSGSTGPAADHSHVATDLPLTWAGFRELLAAVQVAVSQLPCTSQDVVRRFLQDDETPQEIGRALGRPAGTVRVQLHRGLRHLRDLLPKGLFALPFLLLMRETQARPPLPGRGPRVRPWLPFAAVAAGALSCLPVLAPVWSAQVQAGAAPVLAAAGKDKNEVPAGDAQRTAVAAASAEATGNATLVFRFADGATAAGVGVCVAPAGTDPDFGGRRAVTDAAGQVALAGLSPGEYLVTTDRGTKTTIFVRAGVHRADAVELPAGVQLKGRVIDADGTPAAGAWIWLCHSPRHPWDGQVTARSDADGVFSLRDVAPMTTFAALMPGRVPSPMQAVGPRPRGSIELRLGGPAATVAGTVVDEAGAPVCSAVVRVARHARAQFTLPGSDQHVELHPCRELLTDAEGRFSCGELPLGRLEVSVRGAEHAAGLVPVHVGPGVHTVSVVLRPGTTLRGSVRAAGGGAVAGATVVAHGPVRHQWSGVEVAGDGTFALGGLDPARVVLEVEAPGFSTREMPIAVPHREALAIELVPLPRCRGRLLDASGQPANADEWELGFRPAGEEPGRISPQTVPLGANGAFELEAAPGLAFFCRPRDDKVWLPCSSERAADGALAVRLLATTGEHGVLEVRLHGATPAQLADSIVLLERDGEVYAGNQMPASSSVRLFATVPAGQYRVHVFGQRGRCPACFAGLVAVTAAGATVDVTVPPAGTLNYSLRVGGRAVERCGGFVVDEHGLQVPLREPVGSLCLAEGRYELWAHGLSFMTVRGLPFEIRAGAETQLEVPVRPGLVRHIAFVPPPDVPLTAAHVQIECRGRRVLGGEPGLVERGFDSTADGICCVPILLADDEYTLELRAGERRFVGRFAVAGEDGVVEPIAVPLVASAGRH